MMAEVTDWLSVDRRDRILELSDKYGNTRLARGTFGEIHLAIDTGEDHPKSRNTWSFAAVKVIQRATVPLGNVWGSLSSSAAAPTDNRYQLETNVFDELTALRLLNPHPCIVPLLSTSVSSRARALHGQLSLAFSYSPIDFQILLERRRKLALPPLDYPAIKRIFMDIMHAVHHCHEHGVVHGDLKPGNLLLSPQGRVQLCDFGLAKPCPSSMKKRGAVDNSKGLCSLIYRPPECLLGDAFRDPSGDVYCAGLVLSELLLGTPLFPGKNVLDQLGRMFQVLGTPNDDHWPDARNLPDFGKMKYPISYAQPWSHIVPRTCECPLLKSLLSALVELDPKRRWSASTTLRHEWFTTPPYPTVSLKLGEQLIPFELETPRVLFSSENMGEAVRDDVKRTVDMIAKRKTLQTPLITSARQGKQVSPPSLRLRLTQLEFTGRLGDALRKKRNSYKSGMP